MKDAEGMRSGNDVMGLIHSPKNIGECRNQFMFFTKGSSPFGTPCFKVLRKEEGQWPDLCNEVKDYCNQHIPPHNLISISLYEDAHPNDGGGINACITHTAGANPAPISDKAQEVAAGPIYEIQVITETGEWEDMFGAARDRINQLGGQEGHLVASTNDSSVDGGVIIVLSWKHILQANMMELDRPAGCMEQCTIF